MPNLDSNHATVVRTLVKAGWEIIDEQHYLSIGEVAGDKRRLFIDIKALHYPRQIVVLIEVKNLENSPVHELMEMIGQYVVYRSALNFVGDETPLYIAIPDTAYEDIITHPLGRASVEAVALQMMIYNGEKEEIMRWIPEL